MVAVAAECAVVEAAVAAADEGKNMNSQMTQFYARAIYFLRFLVLVFTRCAFILIIGLATALTTKTAHAQKLYATPEAAADALVDAIKRNDEAAMKVVLGANWKTFIPPQDRDDVDEFLKAWDKLHRVRATDPGLAVIEVGDQNWQLPVPLEHRTDGWRFDVKAGADEMRTRRIGRNELAAMQAVQAYFDAQKDYAQRDRMNAGVLQYAQKFVSSPAKHDGLYWPVNEGEEESPLGPLFSSNKRGAPYYGYHFKILTAQGEHAPGGAYNYLIGGRMISGFALVAWPFRYGDSGIMSFIISHNGTIYQKDLGEKSDVIAQSMTLFNPDPSWQKISAP